MGESSHRDNNQNKVKEVPIEGQQAQLPFRCTNGVEGNRSAPGPITQNFQRGLNQQTKSFGQPVERRNQSPNPYAYPAQDKCY